MRVLDGSDGELLVNCTRTAGDTTHKSLLDSATLLVQFFIAHTIDRVIVSCFLLLGKHTQRTHREREREKEQHAQKLVGRERES